MLYGFHLAANNIKKIVWPNGIQQFAIQNESDCNFKGNLI